MVAVPPMIATQIRAIPVELADGAVAHACLSSSERRIMQRYRHPQRRREFVAGRYALKHALLEIRRPAIRIGSAMPLPQVRPAQCLDVLPDDDGRPRLWTENSPAPAHVSIAHAAGWAAGACSHLPIGIDIVDLSTRVAVPDDCPWLDGVDPDWRPRLRALLWGLRESLLKTGQVAAKATWALQDMTAVPVSSAREVVANWPRQLGLAYLEIEFEQKRVAAAFVPLCSSVILVIVNVPDTNR